ncbi:hypothetical protein D9611_007127 [Ephemerocybe angulata]|uniref:Uncharacterized protein n=1 Tax=Ephemerocybe angulata TaxID=980116 RepID=A0A8H5B0Z7_9AGAR|nr:hypothetical protein D9611_007127 [Tulosesus angulatus]
MATYSRLLSIPHELTTEIVAHLAHPVTLPSSPCLNSPSFQSHWDAFSQYKLAPPSSDDLRNLALTHTQLLPFCRSQLFRSLRIYPGITPARVSALVDLFRRAPELVDEVKMLWWTVGVEEYKSARAGWQWFKHAFEEREVRNAGERLDLVCLLAQRGLDDEDLGIRRKGSGLRRVWITGCESQRMFDAAQSRGGPSGLMSTFEDEEAALGVMKVLQGVLSSQALSYVSMVNIAFPAEALRLCENLRELRLGEGVTVVPPVTEHRRWHGWRASPHAPACLRVLTLQSGHRSSRNTTSPGTDALFEHRRDSNLWDDEEDQGAEFQPVLDLRGLESLSCQYPSRLFAPSRGDGAGKNLKAVSLQVTDFDTLADDIESGAFPLSSDDQPLEHLSLSCTLPPMPSGSPAGHLPTQPPSSTLHSPMAVVPPLTPSGRLSQMLSTLATARDAPESMEVELRTSVEQGARILRATDGLDLLPLARKLASTVYSGFRDVHHQSRSLKVNFSLAPSCTSVSPDGSLMNVDEQMGQQMVDNIAKLEGLIADRHAEAVAILGSVGVHLGIGYTLTA